jgi:hypothetical protein
MRHDPVHSLIVQKVGYGSKQLSVTLYGVRIDFLAAAFVDVRAKATSPRATQFGSQVQKSIRRMGLKDWW